MKARSRGNTDLEILVDYLFGQRETISDDLVKRLERLQTCADIIRKHGSRLRVIPAMIKLFSKSGTYTAKQAQKDFDDTQELFGTNTQSNRMFWFDIILGMMIETRNNAYVKRKYNTASIIEARMMNAVRDFIGDNEAFPIDKLQPQNILLGFFPELLNIKLPDNVTEHIEKLKESKRKKELMVEDAEVMPEEENLNAEGA